MANSKTYSVQITGLPEGGRFNASQQSDTNNDWRTKLKEARANKIVARVNCLCKGQDDDRSLRRMVVSYREDTDKFYLSAWQYTGCEHRHDCRYYSVWADKSSANAYTSSVVKINADGTFTIKLPVGLSQRKQADTSGKDVNPATHTRTGQPKPSMSLLGLVQFIWHHAGINTWKPQYVKNKSRDVQWLSRKINMTAENIRISRLKFSDVLLVSAQEGHFQASNNKARVRNAQKKNSRMVAMALLAAPTEDETPGLKDGVLSFESPHGFPALSVSPNILEACKLSFRNELKAWKEGYNVVAVAETEPPEVEYLRENGKNIPVYKAEVIGIALMVVTPRFIPIDSGHEATIEALLCEQERSFIKPVRFDAEDDTFPDFVLTDVEGRRPVPMEVFGMNSDGYNARREAKVLIYNDKYGECGWWSWDATPKDARKNIPPFPTQKV